MKENEIEENLVIMGKDSDMNIHYNGSKSKEGRPWLIVSVNYKTKFFWIIPFNKKTQERIVNNNKLELDEFNDSVLSLNNPPKKVAFSVTGKVTKLNYLSDKSIRKIEEQLRVLGLGISWKLQFLDDEKINGK